MVKTSVIFHVVRTVSYLLHYVHTQVGNINDKGRQLMIETSPDGTMHRTVVGLRQALLPTLPVPLKATNTNSATAQPCSGMLTWLVPMCAPERAVPTRHTDGVLRAVCVYVQGEHNSAPLQHVRDL